MYPGEQGRWQWPTQEESEIMVLSVHLSKHKCPYLGDSSLSLQRTRGTSCTQLHHKAVSTLRILKVIFLKNSGFGATPTQRLGRRELGRLPLHGQRWEKHHRWEHLQVAPSNGLKYLQVIEEAV